MKVEKIAPLQDYRIKYFFAGSNAKLKRSDEVEVGRY